MNMIIIGAGHAAVRAAGAMREAGYDGPITMIASEGIDAPYERPPLSKWSDETGPVAKPIMPEIADLTRMNSKVAAINPEAHTVTLHDRTTLPYDRLLIATGGRARPLDGYLTLRDLDDAQTIHQAAKTARKAVIIGGGFIGLELAASLRGMGVAVHVVEMADRLLSRAITAPVAQIVHDLHAANGVTFSFGEAHDAIPDADLRIAGIGSIANTELAEEAGLTTSNGITVDATLRTSHADIFAAGDCCSFPLYGADDHMTRLESWQAAGDQGALAGRNMVAENRETYTQVPWFWSNQYDHVLQVSGLPSPLLTAERSYGPDHHVSFGITEHQTLGFACGIAPQTKVAKDIRFAAKMIEAGVKVEHAALANTEISLKGLLRA